MCFILMNIILVVHLQSLQMMLMLMEFFKAKQSQRRYLDINSKPSCYQKNYRYGCPCLHDSITSDLLTNCDRLVNNMGAMNSCSEVLQVILLRIQYNCASLYSNHCFLFIVTCTILFFFMRLSQNTVIR